MGLRRLNPALLPRLRRAPHAGRLLLVGLLFPALLQGQQAQNPEGAASTARATLHGVVLNATSGEPLARALVRVTGDGGAGALTDGEGRFELADVGPGRQQIEILKPGYLDATAEAAAAAGGDTRTYAHTVMVGAEMPDVTFRMEPANAIHGQVQLSSGDLAEGIEMTLLHHTVESGRFVWQVAATTKTNAEGTYRFGGLPDGTYALYTAPTTDTETAGSPVDPRQAARAESSGYASQFYPETRDLSAAAKLQLQGGEQTEANLTLTLEAFHPVTATMNLPPDIDGKNFSPDRPGTTLSAVLTDSQGHPLAYVAQYDEATHTVQTRLPDGNYVLIATAGRPMLATRRMGIASSSRDVGGPYTGAVDFSVAGHAMTGLHIPLAAAPRSVLQVNLDRSGAAATASVNSSAEAVLTISQTGAWLSNAMVSTYAVGTLGSPVTTIFAAPGTYWVQTNLADRNFCEGSLLAGGSSLAREPLTLSASGSSAPLTLTLRDDCAKLTMSLPAAAEGPALGEEPAYTVYAIPDFETTADVIPQTLRASTGGQVTLDGLTPGNYHVYVFDKPVALAYHDRSMIDALPTRGQAINLASGQSANLLLEVPQP
ncbi:MAG TPA: carboxypeptidase-like regulatory domain-containing protein [Terracidiphilus sp.]|nr:carboxypeptidase-like regulatory domain-containing protein [Terracidiphilus sp.]